MQAAARRGVYRETPNEGGEERERERERCVCVCVCVWERGGHIVELRAVVDRLLEVLTGTAPLTKREREIERSGKVHKESGGLDGGHGWRVCVRRKGGWYPIRRPPLTDPA